MRTIKNRNVNGRPKLGLSVKKGYKITVKLATAEYIPLKTNAKLAGMTISSFVREALQRCEVRERLNATHLHHILQLTGMANNLNQIAKRANAAGYIAAKTESETSQSRLIM